MLLFLMMTLAFLAIPGQAFDWTSDHIMMGVRWQPHYDIRAEGEVERVRYALEDNPAAKGADFVYIWCFWETMERPGEGLVPNEGILWKTMHQNILKAHAAGLKVHLVLAFTPAWAYFGEDTLNRTPGSDYVARHGYAPSHSHVPIRNHYFADFCRRISGVLVDAVDGFDLWHESNLDGHWKTRFTGGFNNTALSNFDEQMENIRLAATAIREVYAKAGRHVELNYSGTSPCGGCGLVPGLMPGAANGVRSFYDRIIANKPLMERLDNIALNVSDVNGYGSISAGGTPITSAWDQFSMMRRKLDSAGHSKIGIAAGENWINWDECCAPDINADGKADEYDAAIKTVRIVGNILHRGLNVLNLPLEDNDSPWAMGLTKRLDHGGLLAARGIRTVPNSQGPFADPSLQIAVQKYDLSTYRIIKSWDNSYARINDPVHLHFHFWNWFARLTPDRDECIRHALPPDVEPLARNHLMVSGTSPPAGDAAYWPGLPSNTHEVKVMSSWNRTRREFIVLLYSPGEKGDKSITFALPSTIQAGTWYNNGHSTLDFRGEGIPEGATLECRWETKNISFRTGLDEAVASGTLVGKVAGGNISVTVPSARKFTALRIRNAQPVGLAPPLGPGIGTGIPVPMIRMSRILRFAGPPGRIRILSITGKEVLRPDLDNSQTLDLSDLPSGVYLIGGRNALEKVLLP